MNYNFSIWFDNLESGKMHPQIKGCIYAASFFNIFQNLLTTNYQ